MAGRAPVRGTKLCRNYSAVAKLPPTEFQPKKYAGPLWENTEKIKSEHIPPSVFNFYKKPLLLHQGHKQWLFDHTGRRYLDLLAGVVTVSVGHCHPKVVSAVKEQMDSLWHTTNIYRHPKLYEYVEKLADKFPGDLKVVYLVNSGSEANDLAVLLARLYTGNNEILSLQGSYHGYSSGLMGLTSMQSYRLPLLAPSGFHHVRNLIVTKNYGHFIFLTSFPPVALPAWCAQVPLPDPFRGAWGGCRDSPAQAPGACSCPGDCVATDNYIHQLKQLLEHSVPVRGVAALFAESIQGGGGTLQFTKGYLKKAQELVKNYGGLYIADEVQTGFGRTGDHFWGFEGHGVTPDIVTLAKGIGNGFPLAAVVTTRDVAAAHARAAYFNTFGGNPLASAAGKAVLEVIEEEKLQENCKVVGKYFIEKLKDLQARHSVIGDVRGKGLMLGVELVTPGSKEPLDNSKVLDILEATKDMGVLVGRGGKKSNTIRLKPPMCITKEDVDFSISVLDEAVRSVMQ
ncbi:Alanine--glyoxylate aminotransferase 2, mitochondrial [Eumeta japonica]|uniref:Alanine--glyoxylate aminotransferase 2, mitochondrial n=1 Tax=Eumeta variegata TaxID=151549 RepID=A0A4C1T644_EUMVA|nr:Alanine--glyoxylate aminotransferase 2, mitochondrial [Eumeta japonica]